MGDIVDLKTERDGRRLIVVCSCGCTTHHHYVDGSIACAACALVMGVATAEWRECMPDPPEEVKPVGDSFKIIPITTAKDSLLRWAKSPDVDRIKALVLMMEDGGVTTSLIGAPLETEEQRQWLGQRFEDAFENLTTR